MPRKLRTSKRRLHAVDVAPALFHYLVWRDYDAAAALLRPEDSKWLLFDVLGPNAHQHAWRVIEEEAVEAWVEQYPGSRPSSWWHWSAPEVRGVVGAFRLLENPRERCWSTGIPFLEPHDWSDPPFVESQPAYLERLNLWRPGERERVSAEAFEPQRWSLAKASNGECDED
jgi:hypothetical protein